MYTIGNCFLHLQPLFSAIGLLVCWTVVIFLMPWWKKMLRGGNLLRAIRCSWMAKWNQYICFVAIRSNVWCHSWYWSFDDYNCGRHEASWTRRGNGRFLAICVLNPFSCNFSSKVQGLSMRVKKTQHSQRWINTLSFISISTFKPIPIYIYMEFHALTLILYLLKCSSFVPPLW